VTEAPSSIFEKNYRDYLTQIAGIDFHSVEGKLGIRTEGTCALIPLFDKTYRVSGDGIVDSIGRQASYDACVILCKYLLLCPDASPQENEWVSYRNFKDAGPLTTYFLNDVELPLARHFSGRPKDLEVAGATLGGRKPGMDLSYEVSLEFDALPRVPLLMVHNDADDEFPAQCSVLFEKRAGHYLDAECLAMVGRLLFVSLKGADVRCRA
jgi:hypothetical protein